MGLDKNLVCCNPNSKETLMTIQCEQPLTAVDFENDGVNLAVGTSRGRLVVYALRSPKQPVESLLAHNSSVSSAVFKSKLVRRLSSSSSSNMTSSNKVAEFSPVSDLDY